MAHELENLEIIIDVLSDTDAILELIGMLETLDGVAEQVDNIRIDVDVNDRELDTLLAKLAATDALGATGVGGGGGGGRGGRGLPTNVATMNVVAGNVNLAAAGGGMSALAGSIIDLDESVGSAAQTAADFADDVTEQSGRFRLRMSDMHNAVAQLIPLLLVFIGALPAVVTGIIALAGAALSAAAALGAIGVFGAIGLAATLGDGNLTEGLQEITSFVRDTFLDAFEPLSRRLAPLFERGLDGLAELFVRIDQVASRALTNLTDDAIAFGRFMMDFIPAMLRNMAEMAEAFGPVFGMLADFFSEFSFAAALTDLFADMVGPLTTLAALIVDMLPTIIRMSIGFLQVTNGILMILGAFGRLLSIIPISDQMFGAFIGTMLTLITVVALLNTQLAARLGATLVRLGATSVPALITALKALVAGNISAASSALSLSGALSVLRAVIIGLLAATGIGLLVTIVGTVAGSFMTASDSIDTATSSLREFNRVGAQTSTFNPYGSGDAPDSGVRRSTRGQFTGNSRSSSATFNITTRNDGKDVDTQARNMQWRHRKFSGGV